MTDGDPEPQTWTKPANQSLFIKDKYSSTGASLLEEILNSNAESRKTSEMIVSKL